MKVKLGNCWNLAELDQLIIATSEETDLTDEGLKHFFHHESLPDSLLCVRHCVRCYGYYQE